MSRIIIAVVAWFGWCGAFAAGQATQPVRLPGPPTGAKPLTIGAPAEQPKPLSVEVKLYYICKQLELTERQWQHVDGLFAILQEESRMTREEMAEHLRKIQNLFQDMEEAKKAGDTQRAEALREQLRGLAPGVAAEKRFVDGLMPALTPEQQAKFKELLKKLENARAEDLELKPIEVVRLARGLDLTPEQLRRLGKVQKDFREYITGPGRDLEPGKQLDHLVAQISQFLTPDQRAKFEAEVDRRRLESPFEQEEPAQTQPAAP